MRGFQGYDRLIVVLAKGGPAGYSRFAPGTAGSILGFVYTGFLWLIARDIILMFALAGIAVAVSIPILAKAERIVGEKDPNRFTLDEIVAAPFCLFPWVLSSAVIFNSTSISWIANIYHHAPWKLLILFGAFRLFDILKPFGVYASQRLPYGLGIVVDDLLAAVYASLLTLPLAVPHMRPSAG